MTGVYQEVARVSLSLLVIMNAFGSIPIFLLVTKGMNRRQRARAAGHAVGVAAIVLFAFLFFGRYILEIFRISLPSLKMGGGIVLAALGLEIVLGISFSRRRSGFSSALSLIGTPLLTGPGVIATTVIFVQEYGYVVTSLAALTVLGFSWLVLLNSSRLQRILGMNGVEIVSRVMGLLLVMVAMELIVDGVRASF